MHSPRSHDRSARIKASCSGVDQRRHIATSAVIHTQVGLSQSTRLLQLGLLRLVLLVQVQVLHAMNRHNLACSLCVRPSLLYCSDLGCMLGVIFAEQHERCVAMRGINRVPVSRLSTAQAQQSARQEERFSVRSSLLVTQPATRLLDSPVFICLLGRRFDRCCSCNSLALLAQSLFALRSGCLSSLSRFGCSCCRLCCLLLLRLLIQNLVAG